MTPAIPTESSGNWRCSTWTTRGIAASQAWGRLGPQVRIGVVDSGVFAGHEDFHGTKFKDGTKYCVLKDSAERSDVSDLYGHGTFVTGNLVAAGGNGVGVGETGLAPHAEIVPLKCFTEEKGSISDVFAAIYGGIDDYHCQVLNMSFGVKQSGLNQSLPGIGALVERVDDQWRMGEPAGERTLFVRMADLPPENRVWLIQDVRNGAGAQTGAYFTEKTTAGDEKLRYALPLCEIETEKTMRVLVLDGAFRPPAGGMEAAGRKKRLIRERLL